jgi:4-alpha-methyl-delta7-sterol-4alpha-methyl oxidase
MFSIYREPLFLLFPLASLAIGAGAFLLFALPMHWLAVKDCDFLRGRRLQRRAADAKVLWQCVSRLGVNLLCMLALAPALWPVLRLSRVHAGGAIPWLEMAWQLPLFFVADDVLFYFLHRLLHTRWLFKVVHAVHHRMAAPTALAGAYFHPLEYAAINLIAVACPLLLGSDVVTIWAWAIARQWLAAEGHSGYELTFGLASLFPGYDAAFHDWHHKRCTGNYANCIPALDRCFGTLSLGYRPRGTS